MSTLYYEVNSLDVSLEIESQSLSIYNRLTSSPNTAFFVMTDPVTAPAEGNSVLIYLDDTSKTLFAGLIVSVTQKKLAPGRWNYTCNCSDYQRLFDKRLVIEEYYADLHVFDITTKTIIEDIVSNFTDPTVGFTTNNVTHDTPIIEVKFDYRYPSDCLTELAENANAQWYIDADKDIHFFVGSWESDAPYEINDSTLKSVIDTFNVTNDYSQIRNFIYVRGGYELGSEQTETIIADGSQRVFHLPFKAHDFSMTVDGTPKDVGEMYTDIDDGSYEYFHNYFEKIVKCASAEDTPAADVELIFTFKAEEPVIQWANNPSSISALAAAELGDGRYEYIWKDATLGLTMAGIVARNLINKYKDPETRGSFTTYEYGFKQAQKITLDVTDCAYNDDYTILSVTIESQRNNILIYSIEFGN